MDIIARLTKSQRDAYDYVQGVVARGMRATEALNAYRAMGQAIRTTSFYDLFNNVFGAKEAGYHIESVRPDYFPDVARIPLAKTDIRNNFSYNVRLDMYNPDTNERFSKNVTVTSSENMRIIDIKSEAINAMTEAQSVIEGSNSDIENVVVESSVRKADVFTEEEE